MHYIKYTQVDSVTGIPVTIEHARGGPVPPAISGLTFGFALESKYPTLTPTYYGTAPDASDIDIPGVLGELTEAEYQAAHDAEIEDRVEMGRDRLRIAVTDKRWQVETGGVTLPDGTHVFTGTDDQNRITSVIANAAAAGVESVDFKAPSGWVTLTLAEMQGVASVIALHVQACFTAERAHHEAIALLDAQGVADYDIDVGWPGATDPA